jgi:hypothetical protein
MPFSDQFDDIYQDILIPAIEKAGYKPVRGDSVYGVGPVIEDIFFEIRSASVLVADVTGNNANVNYELGAAHALNKPVVVIYQSAEDVPFDYSHLRVIRYDRQEVTWAAQLTEKIIHTLKAVKDDATKLDSGHEGRKRALIGTWVGKVDQEMPDGMLSSDVKLEIVVTPNGIEGEGILNTSLVDYPLVLKFSCGVLYDQFVRLEYVGADPATIQFGTWVARLSASGRKIEGRYVGYGSITDKIVTGHAMLDKQPGKGKGSTTKV